MKYANFTYLSYRKAFAMKKDRREFLRKSLKAGALAGGLSATSMMANPTKSAITADGNGVVVGNSNKKEVLYYETPFWKHYYRIAY